MKYLMSSKKDATMFGTGKMTELRFQKLPISTDTSDGRQLGVVIWSGGSKEPPCGLA